MAPADDTVVGKAVVDEALTGKASASAMSATPAERFFAPIRANAFWSRSRFIGVLAAVLLIHAAGLALFLYRDKTDAVPPEVETPVEVVVEPPPAKEEPQPPPKPQPKQEARAEDEKPATSAPRVPPPQAAETRTSAATTQAPKAAAPPQDGQPTFSKAATAAAVAAAAHAAGGKTEDDRREAEALDKASPDPTDKTSDVGQPDPKADAADAAARQLSGYSAAAKYTFAAPTAMAPFPPGTEDNRYLAVVYGMVMSKRHYRGSAAAQLGLTGTVTVTFVVDILGHVHNVTVVQSSGTPILEALALAAVRTAGPLPPPPGAGPKELVATMSFGGAEDK